MAEIQKIAQALPQAAIRPTTAAVRAMIEEQSQHNPALG